jgi:hypothetical protein
MAEDDVAARLVIDLVPEATESSDGLAPRTDGQAAHA